MGSKGGGGTNTVTSVSQPPQWLQNNLQSLYGQAQNITSQPLSQYGGQTIAGFTPSQQAAFNTVDTSQGMAQPYYNQAQNLVNQSTQPLVPQITNNISAFQNPYTQQVVNATQKQLAQNDAIQQQQLMSGAIQSGASPFGGDRAGIAASALAGQQDLANNQTIAGLYSQGYTQASQNALNATEAGAYLGQQGAQNLANIGGAAQNSALQGASSQLQTGALQQQLAQEALNVPYEQFVQQQAYPYQQLGALEQATGLAGGLSGGTSSTTSPSPSTASQIGGLGLTGLGLFGAATSGQKSGGKIKDYDSGGVALPNVPDLSISYMTGMGQAPQIRSDVPAAPKGSISTTSPASSGSFSPGSLGLSAGALKEAGAGLNTLWGGAGSWGGISGMMGIGSPASNALAGTEQMPAGLASLESLGGDAALTDAGATAADAGMSDAAFSSFLDALPLMAAKKGGIAGYADGGLTPFDTSANPLANNITSQYSQLSSDQLRQLSMRIPANSPQAQIVHKLIQQKSQMPNVGMKTGGIPKKSFGGAWLPDIVSGVGDIIGTFYGDPMAGSQATEALSMLDNGETQQGLQLSDLRRGGIASYADGGDTDDQMSPQLSSDINAADPDVESQKDPHPYIDHSGDTQQVVYPSTGEKLDLGIPSDQSGQKQEVKPDKWESIMAAGLGMMGGTSPFAAVNIGRGGLEGLKNYEEQKADIVRQQQEQNQQQQVSQSGKYQTGELANKAQELAQQKAYQQQELGLRREQIEMGKYSVTPWGDVVNTKTGEVKTPGAPTGSQDVTSNITQMSPMEKIAYMNTLKKNQPKDLESQQAALASLYDQKTKIDDLVNQIPVASHGDYHTLTDFVDRNKIPILSDPKRAAATVDQNYDSLGNALDNIRTTFGQGTGNGRVLAAEFNALKQELNVAKNASPEQKAEVVGKISSKLNKAIDDNVQYTKDVQTGAAYLPTYQSPFQKRLTASAQSPTQPTTSPSGSLPPMNQRIQGQVYPTPTGNRQWLGNGWGAPQ